MGRENLEDYNADFLTMLQTWDAAVGFSPSKDGEKGYPVDIAYFLMDWASHKRRCNIWNLRTPLPVNLLRLLNFLVGLNSGLGDATVNYLTSRDVINIQPIEITRLLGWTALRTGDGAAVSFWPSKDGQVYQPIDSASPLAGCSPATPPSP